MSDEFMDTAYSIGNDHYITMKMHPEGACVTIFRLHEDQLSDWGIAHRVEKWDELTIGGQE